MNAKQFAELSEWAQHGIERFWSREIEIDAQKFTVHVRVVPRLPHALKIKLAVASARRYARSHNSGIICACLKFNAGFFRDEARARENFELTAAHEFGHSVLYAAGGLRHSWGHKGSGALLFQRTRKAAPAYPTQGEIDLMRYYNAPIIDFHELLARSCAAEEDVAALVRLGMKRD